MDFSSQLCSGTLLVIKNSAALYQGLGLIWVSHEEKVKKKGGTAGYLMKNVMGMGITTIITIMKVVVAHTMGCIETREDTISKTEQKNGPRKRHYDTIYETGPRMRHYL
ncbi:S2-RNase [Pyrus ussuriensis x Pyrus communis]|uniref:S2-RNase n=1 Tax=Pyrus ussuriensis x Pyrus communis TaxID=2448454 RepID=A0A5N5FYQ8_9ROSA|nr:S2-RNase [Pyrus ussuriensis x Pyrus communis]